jgi:dTDP-4-dehydrorhamnose 3,5-epimerase|tara:strand:- start:985 stop:1422 length:438 start_codon:yes stop_codon:yes gene_type:complete
MMQKVKLKKKANFSLIKLKKVISHKGKIIKILNKGDIRFFSFGELYISEAKKGFVKAWKKHKQVYLNILVLTGSIKFVFFNERTRKFKKIILSESSNKRLFIPKNVWFGFEGLKHKNLLLSLASNSKIQKELMRKKVKDLNYQWK